MTASGVDDHKHSAGVGMWVAWVLGALAVVVQRPPYPADSCVYNNCHGLFHKLDEHARKGE
jgi:hypothetical protein